VGGNTKTVVEFEHMYLIIIIVCGLFTWFVFKEAAKNPLSVEEKSILKFHIVFGLVGMACMVMALFVPFYSFAIDDFTSNEILILVVFFVCFFGMGYWLFLLYRHHKVLYDDKEIIVIDLIKKEKRFYWSDIKEIKLNAWTSKYILTLQSGEKVRIHQYLTGVEAFVRRAGNRLESLKRE
jgi:hypothetical protein